MGCMLFISVQIKCNKVKIYFLFFFRGRPTEYLNTHTKFMLIAHPAQPFSLLIYLFEGFKINKKTD